MSNTDSNDKGLKLARTNKKSRAVVTINTNKRFEKENDNSQPELNELYIIRAS